MLLVFDERIRFKVEGTGFMEYNFHKDAIFRKTLLQ